MASSIAIPRPATENAFKQFARLIPGLALLAAVGYAEKSSNTRSPRTAKPTT